jgi:peptide methionine sulfoxide reductase MsrB
MNQKLIEYLPDLITHFECVIIPEFGGFISEKTGASINSIGSIQAPKKSIIFNQQLNHNDGLLANYIAQKENISYAEAMELIKAEVEEMIDVLENAQVLKINKIGEFRLLNDYIIFKADDNENHLIDSFGLSNLHKESEVEPIKEIPKEEVKVEAKEEIKFEEKKVSEKEATSKPITNTTKDNKEINDNKNIRFLIIAVVLLLLGLAFYTMKDNIFKQNEKSSTIDTLLNQNDSLKLLEDSLNQISEQIDSSTNIAPTTSISNTINNTENVSKESTGSVTEIIDTSSTNLGATMYCIASASFKNEKDALAEKRQLEMIGFEAEIIAMKNATRYQVIIGKYEKYQDAVNELKFAKNIDKKFYLLTVKENK